VVAPHLRTTRAIAAREAIGGGDVQPHVGSLRGELLEPLPSAADVVGATAVRTLAAGEILRGALVRVPVAVRSGDRVVVRAIVGGVEARGIATAQQSGGIGDVIRLVNPETRRTLRGKVVARGEVEVIHGS
jgi:flagella basal body P-ring formation protein FlgA